MATVTDAPGAALPAITVSPSSSMRTTSSSGFAVGVSGAATGAEAGAPDSAGALSEGGVAGAVMVSAGGGGSVSSNRSG